MSAILPVSAQLSTGTHRQDRNAPVLFQADEVQYDEQLGLTVAKGHVEISQGGQILLADMVSYNQRTDTITASGHVSLLDPSGDIVFADFMELRDSMKDAFVQNIRMLLADRSRLAANTGRRIAGNRTELRRGVYSPCDLCRDNPEAPPAWQLKAREMSDDKEYKLLEFRDAVMEIDGWPVFYSPYLSTPEPGVKRASGFLMPSFGNSSQVGFHFAVPYFWAIDGDKDLTITPRFMTQGGELLAAEYRQRFGNGVIDAIASGNYSSAATVLDTNSEKRWRGHVDSSGIWDLDETYRTGFQLQRVSDLTYLQRFGFPIPLLNAMISRGYLEGFEPRAATDINAYVFQPLVPGISDATQPIVLPVANRFWESEPDGWGGRWKLNANLLNIVREVGTQTRRLSLGSEWDKDFRDGIGGQYRFTASLRGDAYSVNDLSPKSNPDLPSAFFSQNGLPPISPISTNFITGRAFPQLGLTWSYPLVNRINEDLTATIEPIAGAYVAPSSGNSHRIPDEDSLGYELRASDLFRPDRLAGYDILDTGQRVDYGLKMGLYNKEAGTYRMLIGQSYRAQPNPFLPPGSGAEQRLSDIVGNVVLQPSTYLDLIYRFRLDKSSLSNRTQEVGFAGGPQALRLGATFLLMPPQQPSDLVTNIANGQSILYGKREQVTFSATAKVTRYWTLIGSETLNLTNSTNLINGVPTPQSSNTSLYATLAGVYQDECMAFIASLTQSGIRNGDVTPGLSVMFSIVFKNLGEIGGTVLSTQGALF
ncbi:MAG: LPS-assembly protein LptD [Alphaproteobacteria bacterium]|nr:LPS-assembly protein LptD [Alphaproteobacteria bacterium]